MKNLTIKNLTEVCSGIYHGPENIMDREVSSITTDSRKIEKDSILFQLSDICQRFASGHYDKAAISGDVLAEINRLLDVATHYGFDGNLWHNYLAFLLATVVAGYGLRAIGGLAGRAAGRRARADRRTCRAAGRPGAAASRRAPAIAHGEHHGAPRARAG